MESRLIFLYYTKQSGIYRKGYLQEDSNIILTNERIRSDELLPFLEDKGQKTLTKAIYQGGRYLQDPNEPFLDEIVKHAILIGADYIVVPRSFVSEYHSRRPIRSPLTATYKFYMAK